MILPIGSICKEPVKQFQIQWEVWLESLRPNKSGLDEVLVDRRVFTSCENVKTDDAEVDANEQMMSSVGGEKGRRE